MEHVQWRDDSWLASFPLNEFTALDYFALSPFYDPASNNEALRRQGLGAGYQRCITQQSTPLHAPELSPCCSPCRDFPSGTHFRLHDSQPPHLFVVRKLHKAASQPEASLAVYYILDGSVYQAPTLHAALHSRMVCGRPYTGQISLCSSP